jgi:hypothetical protein
MISQVAVRVLCEAMMFFAGQIFRIDVDRNARKIRQAVHQLMPCFHSDRMSFGDREFAAHTEIDFGV